MACARAFSASTRSLGLRGREPAPRSRVRARGYGPGPDKASPFKVKWAQITGAPEVTEAFRAYALDVGANVPPIHAVWVGLPVKIIAFSPSQHQVVLQTLRA